MLSWSEVIRHVKSAIGFPYAYVEYDDNHIQEMLYDSCLRKFSTYFPDKRVMGLDCSAAHNIVPNVENMYYVNDPAGREILSIDTFIPDAGTLFILGHPILGTFSWEDAPSFALQAWKANNLKQFSIFNYTIQFFPPNVLRVLPKYGGTCALEYSRVHLEDLSTIQPDLAEYFKDFALAVFKMRLGALRKNYNTVQTPFGEIPLNGSEMYSEGEASYNEIINKFEGGSPPFVYFEIG